MSLRESRSNNIESIISFGDSLFQNRNYCIALHEYQRAFFFAGSELKCQLSEKIAGCYFILEDFKIARTFYDSAIHYSKPDSLQIDYELHKILCFIMENNFGYALLKLNDLEVDANITLQRKKNLYQGICYFGMGQYDESNRHFMNYIPQTDTLRRFQLQQMYENQKMLKRPNYFIAIMLSIIVPGAGQAYSGDLLDGINSLLLLGGLFYIETSGSLISPVAIVPFFYRYYIGGILNAKKTAEEKRKENQYFYYTNLMEILIK